MKDSKIETLHLKNEAKSENYLTNMNYRLAILDVLAKTEGTHID